MKIFVDANIYKYAASEIEVLRPRAKRIEWGGMECNGTVYDFETINPNDNIKNNSILRAEVDLISEIIGLQEKASLVFCETTELMLETWNLPRMNSKLGWLYGAILTNIEPPIKYSRILSHWRSDKNDSKELQFDFLRQIKHKRFEQIQRASGAYQGKTPPNRNQLLDAFHLWCAEHADCQVFLTGEAKKLRESMSRKRNFTYEPLILLPSELLSLIDEKLGWVRVRRISRWLRKRLKALRN